MKIAIVGCAHGELEDIYNTISFLENRENFKVDLLICCGDFQATRNQHDLSCMAVPPKYRNMCTFYKYYSGEKKTSILTIFIGGNHEASNHLQELPYGGWVAPNIYYLGYAGVVQVAGIKIGGLSGIFKSHDYMMGRHERPPYNKWTSRSVYHVRSIEVFRLKQIKSQLDIFLSHDWPLGITQYGNEENLLHLKPYFREDIESFKLGSPPASELLHHLKPTYWFSAHMHCKFAAVVHHKFDSQKKTKFLALDKCLPKRNFLQMLDIPHDKTKPIELEYDLEWLTILHYTNHLSNLKKEIVQLPNSDCSDMRCDFTPTEIEKEFIQKKMSDCMKVPHNFVQTVPPYSPQSCSSLPTVILPNPQTKAFCSKLGITDIFEEILNLNPPPSWGRLSWTPQEIASEDSNVNVSSFIDTEQSEESSFEVSTPVGLKDLEESTSPSPSTRLRNLSLPAPKNEDSGNLLEEKEKDDKDKSQELSGAKQSDSIDKKEESDIFIIDVDGAPSSPSGAKFPKRFKRRNQDIYTEANIN